MADLAVGDEERLLKIFPARPQSAIIHNLAIARAEFGVSSGHSGSSNLHVADALQRDKKRRAERLRSG